MPKLYIEYLNGNYTNPNLNINGCGPAGILNSIVPDEYDGIDLNPACNIHDFMYFHGETEQDRDLADRIFLFNLLVLVDADNPSIKISKKRHNRMILYYNAVSNLGHKFYIYKKGTKPDYDDVLKEVVKNDYDWFSEDIHDGG